MGTMPQHNVSIGFGLSGYKNSRKGSLPCLLLQHLDHMRTAKLPMTWPSPPAWQQYYDIHISCLCCWVSVLLVKVHRGSLYSNNSFSQWHTALFGVCTTHHSKRLSCRSHPSPFCCSTDISTQQTPACSCPEDARCFQAYVSCHRTHNMKCLSHLRRTAGRDSIS